MKNRLGENLKILLAEKQESIEELSQYLGLSRQAVSLYVNGKTQPSIEGLLRISQYFSVSVDYLIGNVPSVCEEQEGLMTPEAIKAILAILKRGHDVQIQRKGDGIAILEVKREIKYRTPG